MKSANMRELPTYRKSYLTMLGVFLLSVVAIHFMHVHVFSINKYFGIWKIFSITQFVEVLLFSNLTVLGMIFYIMGFYPWKLNQLRNGLKNEKLLKRVGYELILGCNLDYILIGTASLGFGFYIRGENGSFSEFRLLIYFLIWILSIIYMYRSKGIREVRELDEKGKIIFDEHIEKTKINPENIDDTGDRYKKAFRLFDLVLKRENIFSLKNIDYKLLEEKYPDDISKILELLNKDVKQDLSVFLFGLSLFQKTNILRHFRPLEGQNVGILISIFVCMIIFIFSHIFF
ncbi:MAG: hypothetical protein HOE90_00190 [Bacteriovoracaceae bacterium]|jgi:hypothetical protein|nr:hypothetical protein [Bacteriovoracaceae bacterium]